MDKINNFINESPLLAWGLWLAYAVIISFGVVIYFYHNSILPIHYVMNTIALYALLGLAPLFHWHSSQRDNALFWRNSGLVVIGFLLVASTILMPIFLNINYMSVNEYLGRSEIEVKELLKKKIKGYEPSFFVFYFNPEQLTNAIKKHNLEVDSTKKNENQQDQSVSDKKDQEIIKTLKNI